MYQAWKINKRAEWYMMAAKGTHWRVGAGSTADPTGHSGFSLEQGGPVGSSYITSLARFQLTNDTAEWTFLT